MGVGQADEDLVPSCRDRHPVGVVDGRRRRSLLADHGAIGV